MIRRFDGDVGGVGAVPAAWLTPTITPPTLKIAERAKVPVFAAIVYVAVPEPVPPPVMVAHVWFEDTLHEQFEAVVTLIVPVAPVGAAVISEGVTENVHVALGSLMVKERPAIVSVAVRESVPVLAPALYPTVPDPVPLAPLVMVTHVDPLDAVQLQFDDVVTVTVPVPPLAGSVALVGEMVNVQGAAGCVTVNVCPAIVIVPVRDVVAVFAATL